MRKLFRLFSRLLGSRPRTATTRHAHPDAELAAADRLRHAAARVELPGPCLKAVGEALIELSRTLPDETEEEI